jgi:gamma-glutamyltranspeptidase / glutathione hydrolase
VTPVAAGVAAGHPATAEAAAEILAEGGSAADAAIAGCLASCVAETVMTGLLGGGHAIYLDARDGSLRNLDCFVAVPSGEAGELVRLQVPFGAELVHYAVGPASCGVPGVPAGLDALWRAAGRLPWARLVEPALRLAAAGVALPPAHAACLAMLEPVMTMNRGAALYAPSGTLLAAGDTLRQPGLVEALRILAEEGAESAYRGTIAESLLGVEGVTVTREDLTAYQARWGEPAEVDYLGLRTFTRGGLSGVPETLGRLPRLCDLSPAERVVALTDVLEPGGSESHTTNLVTVDSEGSACVLTTSLGLGSGDFLPGLDVHLNSMLGELDLVREPLRPRERMQSMMAPTLVLDPEGLVLAAGAAGGTRLRTALVGVLAGVLDEGLDPQAAVDRPRFHPAAGLVNAEPSVDEAGLSTLEQRGWTVRRWEARHHYFGGVSAVGRAGVAGDPRRSGAALRLK